MTNKIVEIETSKLIFDNENPRFSMIYNDGKQPFDEIIERMVKKENIQELMGSISEQGYFSGEPLLVVSTGNEYTVVEGNRRLAALKILNGEILPKTKLASIANIINEAKIQPRKVACIVFSERKEILRYLAYRHVTGPKKWDSLSKAIYIKQLRESFFKELDLDSQLRSLAKEMGSRKDYVAKMLTTLNILEYAEDKDFFGLNNLKREHVDFSVLATALGYSNIPKYVGLDNGNVVDFNDLDDKGCKDIFAWMFLQNESGETVLGESRNLGKLSAVLSNEIATEKLREDRNLQSAYLFTNGPEEAFSQSINMALMHLKNAYETIPVIQSFNSDLQAKIEEIENITDSVMFSVHKKIKKAKRINEEND
ncbi:ParB N-terminal domain-containing protein [Pectobacterium aroidearum]|uniref:ParB N-terminal domain-containing protein n=1 Tax=Pectobacterium aroidearum TaxID=1201031 RepID=UPI00262F5BA7|nr:ParB N-terminal domain-containing protein [Pectobacterium aroidearum]WKA61047.1 ParB N-terminal domain-containing protein [Pectobacterium aroidearum]